MCLDVGAYRARDSISRQANAPEGEGVEEGGGGWGVGWGVGGPGFERRHPAGRYFQAAGQRAPGPGGKIRLVRYVR